MPLCWANASAPSRINAFEIHIRHWLYRAAASCCYLKWQIGIRCFLSAAHRNGVRERERDVVAHTTSKNHSFSAETMKQRIEEKKKRQKVTIRSRTGTQLLLIVCRCVCVSVCVCVFASSFISCFPLKSIQFLM